MERIKAASDWARVGGISDIDRVFYEKGGALMTRAFSWLDSIYIGEDGHLRSSIEDA